MESWLWMVGRAPVNPSGPADFWIWWGPVFGLSDHLELNVPFQALGWGGHTALDSFEVDLRYRIKSRLDHSAFQPLIRVAYHQPIGFRESPFFATPRIDYNLVGSYDFGSGLHLDLDLGGRIGLGPFTERHTNVFFQLTYDVGVSYPVSREVRVSLENLGEFPVANLEPGKAGPEEFVGPSVSWTHGPMWLTFGVMVGLTPLLPHTPHFMPRLIWAVAL